MRAIILAAGMGTRLRPLTLTTPKSLICIKNQTLIERQILFLRERGVTEITIVTGYLAEKFDFLVEKYGVSLVYNDKYDIYNNFYSMYLVRDLLADSYVIDADNYLVANFLQEDIKDSTYFGIYRKGFSNEWEIISDESHRVTDIVIKDGEGYILSGVSYWSEKDGLTLKQAMEDSFLNKDFTDLYWDNIVLEQFENLSITHKKLDSDIIFEIDSLEDLTILEKHISQSTE